MEDSQIIKLYWSRCENAIKESNTKYGHLLKRISFNILSNFEDSEECINDTYMKAWNTMPPQEPQSLMAYLGKIVRNISINLYYSKHTQKRGGNTLLSELSECIPSKISVQEEIETSLLTEIINNWLKSIKKEDRELFIRRYWFGDSVKLLAKECGISESSMAGRIYRIRQKLKTVLTEEGVLI